jgi:hypothetical protein
MPEPMMAIFWRDRFCGTVTVWAYTARLDAAMMTASLHLVLYAKGRASDQRRAGRRRG